jgi:hypothetical protein
MSPRKPTVERIYLPALPDGWAWQVGAVGPAGATVTVDPANSVALHSDAVKPTVSATYDTPAAAVKGAAALIARYEALLGLFPKNDPPAGGAS